MSIWLATTRWSGPPQKCIVQRTTEANQGRRGVWLLLQGILSRPAHSPNRLPQGPSSVICLGVVRVCVGVECKCISADMPSRYSNAWKRNGKINFICYAVLPSHTVHVQTTPTLSCIINESLLLFILPFSPYILASNQFEWIYMSVVLSLSFLRFCLVFIVPLKGKISPAVKFTGMDLSTELEVIWYKDQSISGHYNISPSWHYFLAYVWIIFDKTVRVR